MSVTEPMNPAVHEEDDGFRYVAEQFGDARILRYRVPGFEELPVRQKELIFYLSEAALAGRDIIYHQNYRHNLLIRKTLESIYRHAEIERNTLDFGHFTVYLKRIWFSNGIHHHYSTDKFLPDFSSDYFASLVHATPREHLPLQPGQSTSMFIAELTALIFDPSIAPKRVNMAKGEDLVQGSACNFYEGVTQEEAEAYYRQLHEAETTGIGERKFSHGLNSMLVKENSRITERTWKLGGLYSAAIERIIHWLEKAKAVADGPEQEKAIGLLAEYYRTGSLKTWDDFNIVWVQDQKSRVDFINGFIEVYGDPLARKGSWESVVAFTDLEATRRTEIISRNAAYFEAHSPVDPRFRKQVVKGVTARVMTVAQLGGDSHPTTPIGINLPNAQWIRQEYGSRSVTLDNITWAYDRASLGNGFLEEFTWSQEEVENHKKNGYLAGNLMTDLHECLGHGSGQMLPGVTADSLKNYHSVIEEARADLFALYYIMDPKMEELGLVTGTEAARAEYDAFIRNGLMTQLVRIEQGKKIEEAHMRDRALIAHWVFERGMDEHVIERLSREGKTYFRIADYEKLRRLFGELLAEIQRITSEGDFPAAEALVERYAVQVDPDLHKEVLERFRRLKITPYSGFINPIFIAVKEDGRIIDVRVEYPEDFAGQMLSYSEQYSYLTAREP